MIPCFWLWRRIEGTKMHGSKSSKNSLAMAPPDPRCTIGTNIDSKSVHVTSVAECFRRYGSKKKTIILIGTVLEVKIGP